MKKITTLTIGFILNLKLWMKTKIRYNSSIFSLFLTFMEYYLKGEKELLAIQHKTIGVRLNLIK